MQALAVRYPDIQQHQGVEVSFYDHHINWFGSGFSLPSYGNLPLKPSAGEASRPHPSSPGASIRSGACRA